MPTKLRTLGKTSGAKAQNAEWFAADVDVDPDGVTPDYLIIRFLPAELVVLEVAFDGATYVALKPDTVVNTLYEAKIPIGNADTFNIRTSTVGGVTLRNCVLTSHLE